MKILFCNISYMEYYKGMPEIDKPTGGGAWVSENGYGHEMYNFQPEKLSFENEEGEYCLGFFETKSTNGQSNQLHIEKIRECGSYKNEDSVDDVLVIWCATHPAHRFTTTVGWYRHATVYRNYQELIFNGLKGGEYIQYYNVIAKAEDCVLLPTSLRSRKLEWEVPRRKAKGRNYGFGRANVWFAEESGNENIEKYLKELERKINDYYGENWLNKYPEGARSAKNHVSISI